MGIGAGLGFHVCVWEAGVPRDSLCNPHLEALSGFLNPARTPKVCKIMAFMAVIMGLGLLFYIVLGSR